MKYGGLLLFLTAGACASATDEGRGKNEDLSVWTPYDLTFLNYDLSSLDMTPPPDLTPPLKGLSDGCTMDSECASGMCRAPIPGLGSICVTNCQSQVDCLLAPNFFCEAAQPGATVGLCIPRSPMHCASCNSDSDCGILAERCF
jgi:hypothetical protein